MTLQAWGEHQGRRLGFVLALGAALCGVVEFAVLVVYSAVSLEGSEQAAGIAVPVQGIVVVCAAAAALAFTVERPGPAPAAVALAVDGELLGVATYFCAAHGAGLGALFVILYLCGTTVVAAVCATPRGAPRVAPLACHNAAWAAAAVGAFIGRAADGAARTPLNAWVEGGVVWVGTAAAAVGVQLVAEAAGRDVGGALNAAAGEASADEEAVAPLQSHGCGKAEQETVGRGAVVVDNASSGDADEDPPELPKAPPPSYAKGAGREVTFAAPSRAAPAPLEYCVEVDDGETQRPIIHPSKLSPRSRLRAETDGTLKASPRNADALAASPRHLMHSPREMRKDPKKREDGKLDYKKGLLLGQGAFGKVHIALMGNGDLMAVKNVMFSVSDPEIKQKLTQLQNEINTMKKLEHPHIIRYVATEKEGTSVNIFMEYVPGGSLMDLLKQFGALPLSTASFYTRQILEAVAYLHSESVVHRDIKCANIMITVDGTCKLGDFGAATLISGIQGPGNRRMSFAGTPFWMAPEVVRQEGEGYSNAIDIWSVGCTVIEMVTGQAPFSHAFRTQLEFLRHVVDKWLTQDDLPDLPEGTDTSDELDTFLWHCLQLDPATRPPASDLLLTEWAYWSVLEEGAEPPMSPLNAHSPRKLKAATANRETLGEMYAHWREWAAGRAQRRKVLTMVFEVIVSGTENVLRLQYFTKLKRYAIRDFDERAENWQHLKALQRRDVGEGDAYLKANQRMRRIQSFLMEKSMPALESVAERDQRKASAAPRDGAALLKRRVRHLQIAAQLGDAGEADPEEAGVGLDLKISRRSFMLPKGGSTVQGGKRTMRAKSFRRRESGAPSPTVGVSRRGSTTSTPPPLSARPPMPRLDSEYLGAQIGERVQQIYIHPSHDADIPILALSMTHTEPARSSMSSHTAQLSPSSTASPSSPGQRAERFGTVSFLDAD